MTAKPNFQGLRPTGREMRDPAATLYELEDEGGRVYTSIVFDPRYHGEEALTLNVELVESFMEYPMVTGLVELARHDLDTATFSYPTGRIFTLMDVLRRYRDIGKAPGPRAALEMTYLAAEILIEAGETGPMQGCFSHGNLNPWRIAVRLDGQLQVFGYGLAQVDLLAHMREPERFPVAVESLRYAPPERLEGQPEDASGDLYSLTVAAFEMATGNPLYDTLDVDELKRMIALSEGTSILSGRGHGLPPSIAKTFARALIYDPDTRLSGEEFLHEIRVLLDHPDTEGDGLVEIMDKMRGAVLSQAPKGRKLVSVAGTEMFTPEQLRQMAEEEDDDDAGEVESRWGRVTRSRREGRRGQAEASQTPSPAESAEESPRRRLRRRGDAEDATATPEPAEEAESPRRRLRRRGDAEDATATSEPAEEPESPRRRLRRRAEADELTPAPEAPEAEEESPRRRLRRRAEAADVTAAPEAPVEEEERPQRRLRRRAEADEPTAVPEAPAEEEESPRRRLRRRPTADDAVPAEAPEPPEEEEESPRRRLRRRPEEASSEEGPRRRLRRGEAVEDSTPEEPEDEPSPIRRRRRR